MSLPGASRVYYVQTEWLPAVECYNFGSTSWRFDILKKISEIVKVEICL